MRPLDDIYEIQIDKTNMKATLIQQRRLEDDEEVVTVEQLTAYIKQHGITYGVDEDTIVKVVNGELNLPITIAEGLAPVNGEAAYLKPILPEAQEVENKEDLIKIDLKKVINIPSVTEGQLVGEKIPATPGTPGKNILGEEIPAKPGKDFKLRQGKNVRIDKTKLFSTIDGQMTVEPKVIHVFPVFEVNGDLDLKVGNINFVGTVNIRGNVPAGFEIVSKGDIKVHGLVESATLISEGSIFVSAGIVGQGKGLIKAKGDLHTSFINQGNVDVEGDINVVQSILHSNVTAGGSIYCNKGKGNIVGGNISAGSNITVKEVGNSHNTKTSLYLGVNQTIMKKQKHFSEAMTKAQDDLTKLNTLLTTLTEKEKLVGLAPNERVMKLRIRNTINVTNETYVEAKENIEELQELFEQFGNATLKIENQVFSNVDVHFGKYRRKIITRHQYCKIYLENGEVVITPL